MKRIAAAVDDAESSSQVAHYAARLAADLGADLILVTVGRAIDGTQPELERYRAEEHLKDSLSVLVVEESKRRLCVLRDHLDDTPVVQITCEVLVGNVAEQLVSYAKQNAVDLLVIGHRSRGWLGGLLVGSVAKDVIDSAPCPVLVVR